MGLELENESGLGLDIEFDEKLDLLTINGVMYKGSVFRSLGEFGFSENNKSPLFLTESTWGIDSNHSHEILSIQLTRFAV